MKKLKPEERRRITTLTIKPEDKKFLDEHPEIKQSQVWDKGIQ